MAGDPEILPAIYAGRPSTYDRHTADGILIGIAEGEMSLREACSQISTPTYPTGLPKGTFLGWVVDDRDGLSDRYMRARQIRAHGLIDELVEIADDAREDFELGEKGWTFNGKAVARASLRVSTRQWVLSRMLRDEFGEKVEHTGTIAHNFAGAGDSLAAKLGVAVPDAGGAPVAPAAADPVEAA